MVHVSVFVTSINEVLTVHSIVAGCDRICRGRTIKHHTLIKRGKCSCFIPLTAGGSHLTGIYGMELVTRPTAWIAIASQRCSVPQGEASVPSTPIRLQNRLYAAPTSRNHSVRMLSPLQILANWEMDTTGTLCPPIVQSLPLTPYPCYTLPQ
jgi:hypothetical protein